MLIREETLTWPKTRHWFRLTQDDTGLRGIFGIIKGDAVHQVQWIPVEFPSGITVGVILDAWRKQGCNWRDLFPPVSGGLFAVIREIDLGDYRLLWYVLHINGCPQDSCVVLKKPPAAAAS